LRFIRHNAPVLLAYCAGLIAVCTGLLIIATVFTLQNYRMLRDLSDAPSGRHDAEEAAPVARPRTERYDSGLPPADDTEWAGPVTPYTPADRR
jgi:hypothetical protein